MWKINTLNIIILIFYMQNIYASPIIMHNDHHSLLMNKLTANDDKKSVGSIKENIKSGSHSKHSDDTLIPRNENNDRVYDSYDDEYYDQESVNDKKNQNEQGVTLTLDEFIDSYVEKNYDKQLSHDIFEQMQGDAPAQNDYRGAPKSFIFKPTGHDEESSEEKKIVTEKVYNYQEDLDDYQNDEGAQNEQPGSNNDEIAKPSTDYYINPNFTYKKILLSYKNDSTDDIYIPQFNTMLPKLMNLSRTYGGQDDTDGNLTEAEIRKRYRSQNVNMEIDRLGTKEDWKQELKKRILETVGPNIPMNVYSNRSIIPNPLTNTGNEYSNKSVKSSVTLKNIPYTEKKQSFYPKCEIPRNTDLDSWNHPQNMNLNFNINISTQIPGHNLIVAKATLRLFQFYQNNTVAQNLGTTGKDTSEFLNILDAEDKQIRVSVYWYTKSLKKHRIKRRLSDSKMIPVHENSSSTLGKWVEFNIRPAVKSWIKSGRNHGLGIVIEDQDGNTLQTDKYFKNVDCSIPESDVNKASSYFALFKPPPRPLFEAAVYLSTTKRFNNNNGNANDDADDNDSKRNFTDADNIYNFILFPTIDLCTLEIPLREKHQISAISSHACTFKTLDFNLVNHVDVANYLYDKKHEPNGEIENFDRSSSSYTADTFRAPMTVSLTPDDDNYALQNDEAAIRKGAANESTTVVTETEPPAMKPTHHLRHHHDRFMPKYLLTHDLRDSIINQTLILSYDELLKYLNSKSNATLAQR